MANFAISIIDNDEDGFNSIDDCDDNDDTVFSGAPELCDGKDNDCNNLIDDELPMITVYVDMDNDGFGDINSESVDCEVKEGFVENGDDCDDEDPNINPNATEIANNSIDEDCDGSDLVTSIKELGNATINIFPNPPQP